MNFENLNETTKIRLRNNGINSDDDLINQLLDRIVELERITHIDDENSFWRNNKEYKARVGDE